MTRLEQLQQVVRGLWGQIGTLAGLCPHRDHVLDRRIAGDIPPIELERPAVRLWKLQL